MKKYTTISILISSMCFASACGPQPASKVPVTKAATPQAKPETPVEKASIGKFMKSKNDLSVAERIALYHTLKRESLASYNFEVDKELNQYGYSLLFAKKPLEAIEIFKLLVSEFPNMANPYDSLAEAYKMQGKEELAIVNYEKSFAIDPKNTHAKFQADTLKGVLDILDTDWGKEIFEIPLRFARTMNIVGIEDARFTKGWGKHDSDEFWSYVFAWKIDYKGEVPETLLEDNLSLYFDGLMSRDKEKDLPATTKLKRVGQPGAVVRFEGAVDFMDTRLTKGRLNLKVQGESLQCAEQDKAVIVFWFSPKPFGHATWTQLKSVKVLSDICSR